MIAEAKVCIRCGETKPLTEFHAHRRYTAGVGSYCKPCAIANSRRWYKEVGRFKKHGLTPEEYRLMWEGQEGLCAICETRPVEHIDHDHETGEVRGLLCQLCNHGLGKLGDDAEGLRRALEYVEQGRSPHLTGRLF